MQLTNTNSCQYSTAGFFLYYKYFGIYILLTQPVWSEGNISYNEKHIQTSAHSSLRASSMSVIRTTSKAMVRRKRQWNRNDREESVRSFTLERVEVFCVFGKNVMAQY